MLGAADSVDCFIWSAIYSLAIVSVASEYMVTAKFSIIVSALTRVAGLQISVVDTDHRYQDFNGKLLATPILHRLIASSLDIPPYSKR